MPSENTVSGVNVYRSVSGACEMAVTVPTSRSGITWPWSPSRLNPGSTRVSHQRTVGVATDGVGVSGISSMSTM